MFDTLIEAPDLFWNVPIADFFSTSRLYTGHEYVGLLKLREYNTTNS